MPSEKKSVASLGKSNNQPMMIVAGVVIVVIIGVVAFLVLSNNSKKNTTASTKIVVDEIANAPEGCPKSTTIVVKSDEAGTVKISNANANFLQWRKDSGQLVLTNYTVDTKSIYKTLTGDQVLTVINLETKDASAIEAGEYSKTVAPDHNLSVREFNLSTVGLSGGVFDNSGKVFVTYLGTDYVCGTVTSDDGSSSINGQFIAKYVNNQ